MKEQDFAGVSHHEPIRLDDLLAPHEVAAPAPPSPPEPPRYFRRGEEPLVRLFLLLLRAIRAITPIPKLRPREREEVGPEERRHRESLLAGRLNALLVVNAVLVAAFFLHPAAAAAGPVLNALQGALIRGRPAAIPWILAALWLIAFAEKMV